MNLPPASLSIVIFCAHRLSVDFVDRLCIREVDGVYDIDVTTPTTTGLLNIAYDDPAKNLRAEFRQQVHVFLSARLILDSYTERYQWSVELFSETRYIYIYIYIYMPWACFGGPSCLCFPCFLFFLVFFYCFFFYVPQCACYRTHAELV